MSVVFSNNPLREGQPMFSDFSNNPFREGQPTFSSFLNGPFREGWPMFGVFYLDIFEINKPKKMNNNK